MATGPRIALAVLLMATTACAREEDRKGPGAEAVEDVGKPAESGGSVDAYIRPTAEGGVLVQGDTIRALPSWTQQDWEVARRSLEWAWDQRIDTLPIGERLVRIALTFVGTPYIPQTLDPPGPERLVINLRVLDCVTYVENMLVLAHFVRRADREILSRPEDAMQLYGELLTRIRYRDGMLAGYGSRLHYFTDWIEDNESKLLVEDITQQLGGVRDEEPITFMSAHRNAYRQLTDSAAFAEIRRTEQGLNRTPRYYIPEEQVARISGRISNGDIIAATSTLEGLDIAHTGIAYWQNGALHLLNAPLVGRSVEISEKPIPERLRGITTQDGVVVARPVERDPLR